MIKIFIQSYNEKTFAESKLHFSKYSWAFPILIKNATENNPYFENNFFMNFTSLVNQSEIENCEFIGSLSYKAYKKIDLEFLNTYLEKFANEQDFMHFFCIPGKTVINSYLNGGKNFVNLWSDHCIEVIGEIDKTQSCFSNYWMAKKIYFLEYCEFIKGFIKTIYNNPLSMENGYYNGGNLSNDRLLKLCGKPYYPILPFLLERCTIGYFEKQGFKECRRKNGFFCMKNTKLNRKAIKQLKNNNIFFLCFTTFFQIIWFEMYAKYSSHEIPLQIFQTWETKEYSFKHKNIFNSIQKLKTNNKNCFYFLFDDDDCRNYIKYNFDFNVLKAYDTLIPAAYKADLWRYCILYKMGGIYIDIKYQPVKDFSFEFLLQEGKNVYTKDRKSANVNTNYGIYNGFLISKKENPIYLDLIHEIVKNVENLFYGINCLFPTGPHLFAKVYREKQIELNLLQLFPCEYSDTGDVILYNKKPILEIYKEYRADMKKLEKKSYYLYWKENNIYNSLGTFHFDTIQILKLPTIFGQKNYNACIIENKLFYRSVLKIGEDVLKVCDLNFNEEKELFTYDENKGEKKLDVFSYFNNVHVEDPRVIRHKNNWFICYTDGYKVYIAKLDNDFNTLYSHQLHKPEEIKFLGGDGREKNWIPFSYKDSIGIWYSDNPRTFLIYNDKETKLEFDYFIKTEQIVKVSYGNVRGGCSPILYSNEEEEWIWFFHTFHDKKYKIGAYITKDFKITKILSEPLCAGNPIIFPCGAILKNNNFYISMGVDDKNVGILQVSKNNLKFIDC